MLVFISFVYVYRQFLNKQVGDYDNATVNHIICIIVFILQTCFIRCVTFYKQL